MIAAKQSEISRLLNLNSDLKSNEERRLNEIKANNEELKNKIQEIIKHYER